MAERPILFSGPMVREILAGRKTQTRRPVKPQPPAVEAVRKRSGSDYHLFVTDGTPRNAWSVAGPVWAVREETGGVEEWRCPYGAPGDRLWVRESFWKPPRITPKMLREGADTWPEVYYDGDQGDADLRELGWTRKPSIHMPRKLARILLEVESVRVERLEAISEEDARAEGMETFLVPDRIPTCRQALLLRWDGMYGGTDFERARNPWVWVVTFRRVEAARSAA